MRERIGYSTHDLSGSVQRGSVRGQHTAQDMPDVGKIITGAPSDPFGECVTSYHPIEHTVGIRHGRIRQTRANDTVRSNSGKVTLLKRPPKQTNPPHRHPAQVDSPAPRECPALGRGGGSRQPAKDAPSRAKSALGGNIPGWKADMREGREY
ncbi:hypothetical protein V500_07495 [Pseudogymnoascus sp. VKM F-4518 (FW-2643)]|nr:hypothetical protein V500_07495 [Pseudogymnoascus sp. VKM F-4518 (FW-2643)]